MKRMTVLVLLAAIGGCIPIGFKAQTQMIAPPSMAVDSMRGPQPMLPSSATSPDAAVR